MTTLKTKFAARSAKTLRTNSTDAERKLWSHLRNRQLNGYKFVRQLPVGRFIADFACREADLIIELDGGQHAENAADVLRTAILKQHGYGVMRFWNGDVLTNIEGVLTVIANHLEKAPSPGLRFAKSDLSPKGEVKRATPSEGDRP
jgi:very-short-patch-repair endonuclease